MIAGVKAVKLFSSCPNLECLSLASLSDVGGQEPTLKGNTRKVLYSDRLWHYSQTLDLVYVMKKEKFNNMTPLANVIKNNSHKLQIFTLSWGV
jgi:hypothetical protein